MNILLVRAPYSSSFKEYSDVPLGIGYIGAVLERTGHTVNFVDGQVEQNFYHTLERTISSFKPGLVGLTGLTVNIQQVKEVALFLKRHYPNLPLVFGGPHARLISPSKILDHISQFDAVTKGEAEFTFLEVVDCYASGRSLDGVLGIAFRSGSEVIENADRPLVYKLDDIPFPARHLFDFSKYRPSPKEHKRLPGASIMTSRGCPYRCTFCLIGKFQKQYRMHSARYVVDEIKELVSKYGINDIFIRDDMFTLSQERVKEICQLLISEGVDITFSCLGRADNIKLETLEWMKRAGCWRFMIGIESGNQDLLDILHKDITLDQVRTCVRMCRQVGIQVDGFFMFGIPGETKEKALQTISFAKSLGLDYAQFYLATPYPGTDLREMCEEHGTFNAVEDEWGRLNQFGDENPIYVPNGMNGAELKALQRKAWRSFYLRPSFIAREVTKIRSVDDVKIRLEGLKSLFSF
ncbi:radical SAM protein [Candidatus Woesearchaeota archaeon]|nr:radical SAM protein [Candidatus Woesearchaeota archaeon]